MKRKKAEEPVTPQGIELPPKHGAQAEHDKGDSESAGVIDMDPTPAPLQGKTVFSVQPHVGETVELQPEQHAVKAKRKYTKRAKKSVTVTPTFIDRDAIRVARIQIFTDYVDGKLDFPSAARKDEKFRNFDAAAVDLMAEEKA